MKIIKKGKSLKCGNIENPLIFRCFDCEAVFEAEYGEYNISSFKISHNNTFWINCPCCDSNVLFDENIHQIYNDSACYCAFCN